MKPFTALLAPLLFGLALPAHAQEHHAPPEQGPPTATPGIAHAADLYFDPADMARARAALLHESGGMPTTVTFIDQLEASFDEDGGGGYRLSAQGWHGGDIHRFWWKLEGDGAFDGALGHAALELLYSRAVTPYFDLQAGIAQSYRPEGDRTSLTLGVHGLAPYWFEVGAALYLSNEGELTAHAEAEYDLRLTQKLILQPSAAIGVSAHDIPGFAIGAGFTDITLGARLRYEIRREFAPYVGLEWRSALGESRDLAKSAGGNPEALQFVIGLRTWF